MASMQFLVPDIPLAEAMDAVRVVGWSLVLIALLLIGFYAVTRLRHWMREDEPAVGIGFTLSDLRQLHREGKMTDEEFERAKAKIVAGAKAMAAKLPDPLARNRRRDNDQQQQSKPEA